MSFMFYVIVGKAFGKWVGLGLTRPPHGYTPGAGKRTTGAGLPFLQVFRSGGQGFEVKA